MRTSILSLCLVGAVISAHSGMAADIEAGEKHAASLCVSCHGEEGISANETYPNLAGQKKNYLVQELKSFRDGNRTDPTMSPLAKPLSDDEIENLAAYYSSLDPCQ